ncbi:MAG: DUF503 domain-containing protein [Chloroflexi bacterium]|nr:DUF503 domain-containing protein [Chloroflexota bacterium]
MIVGILTVDLSVPGSNSLKDKRQVIKSVLSLIRNKFNVSAAEIDHLDSHRRAELAFACISNDQALVNRMLDKILDYIRSNPMCEVVDSDLQFV